MVPIKILIDLVVSGLLQGDKFKEAEAIFDTLLDNEVSPLKPDQKMFHMMIYMYKKAGSYDKARRLFSVMDERGVPKTTITYNSLMSFETSYKEVANIYDQVHLKEILFISYFINVLVILVIVVLNIDVNFFFCPFIF